DRSGRRSPIGETPTAKQNRTTASGMTEASIPCFHDAVRVTANDVVARDTYRLRLHMPELGAAIRPGQFVMLRLPGTSDRLLCRPYVLYDTVMGDQGNVTGLDIVYLIVGKQTGRLAQLRAGEQLEIWGPLGHSFPDLTGRKHVALVAGGIGQTP